MGANTGAKSAFCAADCSFFTHKRRIPQHKAALLRRQDLVPVQLEGVPMGNVGRGAQGNSGEVQAKLFAHPQIHLVVHQPQGHLGNLRGEFFDLNAVELIHVNANELVHVHTLLTIWGRSRSAMPGK